MSREDNGAEPGLRSRAWFGQTGKTGFLHRSGLKATGTPHRMFDGRPVIGICNTWSELTPCNAHFRQLSDHVQRGVVEAGGFPVEFPVMSLGETLMRPTSMLYRNLVSMDVEETIRANPIDGVVLLCGCDKTTPALIMGAASCDLPTIVVSGGTTLTGRRNGTQLPSGTGTYTMDEQFRAGQITSDEFVAAEACMWRSAGHCNTMGTASTMACMVEALGLSLPGNAAIPAVDARRRVLAQDSGARIVEMVHEDLRLSSIATRKSFENAIRALAAIGGSTNAVIHLLAIAGRLGVELDLADFDRLANGLPLLVDLVPAGQYLMEDFFEAGGFPVVQAALGDLLHTDQITVTGQTVADTVADVSPWRSPVIRTLDDPVRDNAGIAVLHGNLAPNGAVLKPSAASPELLEHRGRAVVFEDIDDLKARVDDPGLDIDATSVMVLKGAGPRGYPGMPELGNLPIPAKLLRQGITDMVRISDARMSGTAYGTVVLHVSPESAVGGPLAVVRDGDQIELDTAERRIDVLIPEHELVSRLQAFQPPSPSPASGYQQLYTQHVMQADTGADLDVLTGVRRASIPRGGH